LPIPKYVMVILNLLSRSVDNSNFYNPVENHTYAYYLNTGSEYPATPNLTSGNGVLALDLGAGTYTQN